MKWVGLVIAILVVLWLVAPAETVDMIKAAVEGLGDRMGAS